MANDLVLWDGDGHRPTDASRVPRAIEHNGSDPAVDWDLPPEEMGYGPRPGLNPGPVHGEKVRRAAALADADADRARAKGDKTFAALRDTDAADLRQSAWDWGDGRTWLWFAAMFFGFLLLVAFCYFLPYGRHASPPPIRVY